MSATAHAYPPHLIPPTHHVCVQDCQASLAADGTFVKAYARLASCLMARERKADAAQAARDGIAKIVALKGADAATSVHVGVLTAAGL